MLCFDLGELLIYIYVSYLKNIMSDLLSASAISKIIYEQNLFHLINLFSNILLILNNFYLFWLVIIKTIPTFIMFL